MGGSVEQATEWGLQEWFHFLISSLPSLFVLSVVLVANFGTREIQNTPPLRFIEREEHCPLYRYRSCHWLCFKQVRPHVKAGVLCIIILLPYRYRLSLSYVHL